MLRNRKDAMVPTNEKLGKAYNSKESSSHFQMLIAGAMVLPIIANSGVKPVRQNGISIKHGQATLNFSRNLLNEGQPESVLINEVSKKGGDTRKRRYLQLVEKRMSTKPQLILKGETNLTGQVDNYSIGLSIWKNPQRKEASYANAKKHPKNQTYYCNISVIHIIS